LRSFNAASAAMPFHPQALSEMRAALVAALSLDGGKPGK